MTVIVGLVDNGKVWMGGDSAGVSGMALTPRRDAKVFVNGDFIFGFTSSFRMGQLLRYVFEPPARERGEDAMRYMVTKFVPAVRKCFADGGYSKTEKGVDTGGDFLVGHRGELFAIEGDYQVGQVRTPYCAVGCGRDIALGSLHTTQAASMYLPESRAAEPEDRIVMAMAAAEAFSTGVCGPFVVQSL